VYTRDLNKIETIITDWVDEHDLKHVDANFALAIDEATIMLTEAPEVADAELQQAMSWKLKDNTDIDINNSIIECFSIPGQRERGRQPMAYVVAAQSDLLKKYAYVIERSQLSLKSIDISALAQRNIAHLLPEDEFGIALLQLGPSSGLLTVSREGNLFLTRNLDMGYQEFTDGNSAKGVSDNIGDLVESQSSLENIILEVQRSLDYYERYFAQAPIQTLVLAPLPVDVPGLIDYISAQLGISVYELNINNVFGVRKGQVERKLQSRYLPALGAALRFSQIEIWN